MIQQEKCLSELDLEEYHKAKTLFDTEANESRPYEFKYQAREIFTSLKVPSRDWLYLFSVYENVVVFHLMVVHALCKNPEFDTLLCLMCI